MGYDSHLVLRSKDLAALNILNPVQLLFIMSIARRWPMGISPGGRWGNYMIFPAVNTTLVTVRI